MIEVYVSNLWSSTSKQKKIICFRGTKGLGANEQTTKFIKRHNRMFGNKKINSVLKKLYQSMEMHLVIRITRIIPRCRRLNYNDMLKLSCTLEV